MTPVHLVAAAVGFLLLGFFIQKAAMDSGKGTLWQWLPVLITVLCLGVTGSLMLHNNTGDDTLTFLIWFFASAALLFLLIGMVVGRLFGRFLEKASQ